ncbi:unnamed protein product, partial [Mycena citricolor]
YTLIPASATGCVPKSNAGAESGHVILFALSNADSAMTTLPLSHQPQPARFQPNDPPAQLLAPEVALPVVYPIDRLACVDAPQHVLRLVVAVRELHDVLGREQRAVRREERVRNPLRDGSRHFGGRGAQCMRAKVHGALDCSFCELGRAVSRVGGALDDCSGI